ERVELVEPEQRVWFQPGQAEWSVLDDAGRHQEKASKTRQEQRVGLDRKARCEADDGAAMRGGAPVEPANDAGQELRYAAEGDQPDSGKRVRGAAAQAEIEEAQEDDEDDAGPPRLEDEAAHVLSARRRQD